MIASIAGPGAIRPDSHRETEKRLTAEPGAAALIASAKAACDSPSARRASQTRRGAPVVELAW